MEEMVMDDGTQLKLAELPPDETAAVKLLDVARQLARTLWRHQKLHYRQAKALMQQAFGGSDAEGRWQWKEVYEAQEVALVFMLPYYSQRLQSRSALAALQQFALLEQLGLTHSRRSEESVALQQFSTPLQLAYLATRCADIQPGETVLEPSAGTGILAQFCALRGATIVLNELSQQRRQLLEQLFPDSDVYPFNAEHVHDRLPGQICPSVVMMNPPFSASPNQSRRNPQATGKHVRSAFLRLSPGGRLVMLTGHWFSPHSRFWQAAFAGLTETVCIRATAEIAGEAYAKHGTTIATRLTILDKQAPAGDYPSLAIGTETVQMPTGDQMTTVRLLCPSAVAQLLRALPERTATQPPVERLQTAPAADDLAITATQTAPLPTPSLTWEAVVAVGYREIDRAESSALAETLYEDYQPQRIAIDGATPHPTTLCESVALASVRPPLPSYHPRLPRQAICTGVLSEAQLESIIYAGEAHRQWLSGSYQVDDTFDSIEVCSSDHPQAVRFRQGWFPGDGTGAGKAVKLQASSSTTGFRDAAKHSGSPNPTNCSKMLAATGQPWVGMNP